MADGNPPGEEDHAIDDDEYYNQQLLRTELYEAKSQPPVSNPPTSTNEPNYQQLQMRPEQKKDAKFQPQAPKQSPPTSIDKPKYPSEILTTTSSTLADLPSTELQSLLINEKSILQPLEDENAFKWREGKQHQPQQQHPQLLPQINSTFETQENLSPSIIKDLPSTSTVVSLHLQQKELKPIEDNEVFMYQKRDKYSNQPTVEKAKTPTAPNWQATLSQVRPSSPKTRSPNPPKLAVTSMDKIKTPPPPPGTPPIPHKKSPKSPAPTPSTNQIFPSSGMPTIPQVKVTSLQNPITNKQHESLHTMALPQISLMVTVKPPISPPSLIQQPKLATNKPSTLKDKPLKKQTKAKTVPRVKQDAPVKSVVVTPSKIASTTTSSASSAATPNFVSTVNWSSVKDRPSATPSSNTRPTSTVVGKTSNRAKTSNTSRIQTKSPNAADEKKKNVKKKKTPVKRANPSKTQNPVNAKTATTVKQKQNKQNKDKTVAQYTSMIFQPPPKE